jgi:hypothetical protein
MYIEKGWCVVSVLAVEVRFWRAFRPDEAWYSRYGVADRWTAGHRKMHPER